MMTRDEYLELAKKRALEYLPGNPVEAMTSMGSDMTKHPELKDHIGIRIMPLHYGSYNDPVVVRRWIEGFR